MTRIQEILEKIAPTSDSQISVKNFEEVELTFEETEEALRRAREEKFYRQKREEYFERIKANPVKPIFKSKDIYEQLKKQITIDDDNREAVQQLCLYFSAHPAAADYNISLSKGILLCGFPGVGKTLLMRFFQFNPLQSYAFASCTDIENHWAQPGEPYTVGGVPIIDYYSNSIQLSSDPFVHEVGGICFDDLGSRDNPIQKRYGEEKNVMQEIIFNRYNNRLPFNQTHFTTNLDAEQIEAKYGIRVRDRLREMCNILTIKGKSRRK